MSGMSLKKVNDVLSQVHELVLLFFGFPCTRIIGSVLVLESVVFKCSKFTIYLIILQPRPYSHLTFAIFTCCLHDQLPPLLQAFFHPYSARLTRHGRQTLLSENC